ncbi:MAG: patatin-like phospholipase family protein [Patescibacteria group bacterium]
MDFKKPKIVFVLSGGGARGLAHLGFLKVLEKEGIRPDAIIGVSMGAFIGGLYADGMSIKEMEEIVKKISKFQKVLLFTSRPNKTGLIQGEQIGKYMANIIGKKRIENLKIPFYAVATDLNKGTDVVINKGSLVEAILASMAIPALISPVKLKNKILIDGRISNPLPIDLARDLGGELIIVSNTQFPLQKVNIYPINMIGILRRSLEIVESKNLENLLSKEKEIIVVMPKVAKINIMEYELAEKIISLGKSATQKKLEEIKKRLQ